MTRAEELRDLIKATTNKEKECQKFLPDIALHLVPFRVSADNILMTGREESCRTGDSEFSVSVEVDNGAVGRRYAYVWEVKAPQKYLFQLDSATNRLRPSDDLYSAENQLVNYVAELSASPNFRMKFGLTGITDEVRPGGIIIGRKDRFVSGKAEDADKNEGLARFAFSTRDAYLWSPAGIRIYTWDWVCTQLDEQPFVQPAAGPAISDLLPAGTNSLLAYSAEAISRGDELSFRTAVMAAYSAVELKLMPGGWDGRSPSPQQVFNKTIRPIAPEDINFQFMLLYQSRNKSAHGFGEHLTGQTARYALKAAREICTFLDRMNNGPEEPRDA